MKCPKCGHQMRAKTAKERISRIATATKDVPHYVCTACGRIMPRD